MRTRGGDSQPAQPVVHLRNVKGAELDALHLQCAHLDPLVERVQQDLHLRGGEPLHRFKIANVGVRPQQHRNGHRFIPPRKTWMLSTHNQYSTAQNQTARLIHVKVCIQNGKNAKGEADSSASPEGSFVYSCVPLSSTLARVTWQVQRLAAAQDRDGHGVAHVVRVQHGLKAAEGRGPAGRRWR